VEEAEGGGIIRGNNKWKKDPNGKNWSDFGSVKDLLDKFGLLCSY